MTDRGTDVMTEMQKGQEEFTRLLFGELSDRQVAALTRGTAHVLGRLRELVPGGERQSAALHGALHLATPWPSR